MPDPPTIDVIQPLDTASSPEVSKQSSATPPAPTQGGGKDFASLHAAAIARDKPATATTTTPRRERVPVPDGETWAATEPGAHYARITSGPRKGLCINLTHGERRGQTFTIDHRAGKTLHIYTESGKEVVVKASTDASAVTDAAKHAKHPPSDRPHRGERWAPVAGHSNYADILGGPRNGLYVNTSGGIRDGMAFQIVKKGGKWFHVYGTGKDRQWIPSDGPKHKAQHSTGAASGSGGTGAASATSTTGTTGTTGTTATGTGSTAAGDSADAVATGTGGTAPPSAA
jgi:hypothetical protein